MFEFIRTHQRLMQFLLLLLILPSFVLVGVSQYESRGSNDGVATVDGRTITQQEWESAQRRQIEQARAMMGAQFDQKLFDSPEAKQEVLDGLVAERAISAEVARNHLTVGNDTLYKAIQEQTGMKKPDGSFDLDAYKAFLKAQGMSAESFQARIGYQMAVQQLAASVQNTAFAPRSVAGRLSDLNDQQREVQEMLFPASNYAAQVKVTDEMVKAYYDKNAALFQVPETIKAEYVVLNPEAIEKMVTVSDAEIADAYNKNKARFSTPEKRSASHILITVAKDAKPADDAAAKAKAQAILLEVQKAPNDFARIAKAQSQDPGSAELGGDLGVVEKGLFDKPVEDAIFSLKEGEISGLVRSSFGYHIVKVTKVVPATQKPLEEARPEIAAELKKTKMASKYSELAETFTNTVYEQSDSLKPVADKMGLTIETVEGLTRTPNPALGKPLLNNDKFLKAIFSQDAIANKRNTEAVEVAPSTLVSGRVVEFKPATKRPLAEVEAVIRQRVTQEEEMRLARQAGEAKIAAAKASGDATGFGDVKNVSRTMQQPTINPAAAMAVLKADVSKLPAYVGVELPGQGYGVYRIGKVTQPAQPDQARRKQEAEAIARAMGNAELYGYVEALKKKAKAKLNVKAADLGAKAAE
ncbi:Peptidyl-prolyl cis-trans isomerase D [Massilia sp. Bi118]|uniref:SurA N-terminal domain-containing protein n=1 Tax=Massilia sp. Bi118 TaxID=2822346 RepID=UPI001D6265B8|nr:SurA N-terminal domain-containing protein [Massilia sp. Bi118]CAH0192048.1 Peptidyl-prolyl cis-trans isomerase D [Massilia sp. Bi118]